MYMLSTRQMCLDSLVITSEWLRLPEQKKRTPRISEPSVTPRLMANDQKEILMQSHTSVIANAALPVCCNLLFGGHSLRSNKVQRCLIAREAAEFIEGGFGIVHLVALTGIGERLLN
jgi:hypothetical protein